MNGKNLRVKGRYSRGMPYFQNKRKKLYNLPIFSRSLKNNCSIDQRLLLGHFETFEFINSYEEYSYNSNTPRKIIKLKQNHFKNGTVRITRPGIYVLQEDIIFDPNTKQDSMPTIEQMVGSNPQYPIGKCGAYHLGFFAAITIETDNVILDLNGFTIKQSPLHALQQRFFSIIELANSPFIPKQGPGCFSTKETFLSANNLLIRNGKLGLSSHHGIHGNTPKNIVLDNLDISNFEVAGIALNGTDLAVLNKINIHDSRTDVPVLATYSAARFVRSFLEKVKNKNNGDPFITINGQKNKYKDIHERLHLILQETKEHIQCGQMNEICIQQTNMFYNPSGMSDGNVYGLLLHINGVAVNGFDINRTENMIGNKNIYLQNIIIKNISSSPKEVIGISVKSNPTPTAYGGKAQVGPVGEIMRIEDITNNNEKYKSNPLSDAHMLIAKYNNPKIGTTNISLEIVKWVENNTNINTVMSENDLYFVDKIDSMGHLMKGNIGFFISCGTNIRGNNIMISDIFNVGSGVGTSPLITYDTKEIIQGATSNGILFTGSHDISITGSITDIKSDTGISHELYNINSKKITFNDHIVPILVYN
jgi:hypothetical protein